MNWTTRVNDMPSRTKRIVAGGAAVFVAVGGTLAVLWAREPKTEPRGQARPTESAGMQGMEGMAGMNMPSDGTVQLTAEQLREFGVTFGSAEQRLLESEVRTVGIVTFDETRIAEVTPKFGGFVERLYVDFTGQPVRQGQPLIEIYSPELVAAQQELLVAARLQRSHRRERRARRPGAPRTCSGGPARLGSGTSRTRRSTRSCAPAGAPDAHAVRTGVGHRDGEAGGAGTGRPAGADALHHRRPVGGLGGSGAPRGDAGAVRAGSPATVALAAFPGRPFQGRVEYVYPTSGPGAHGEGTHRVPEPGRPHQAGDVRDRAHLDAASRAHGPHLRGGQHRRTHAGVHGHGQRRADADGRRDGTDRRRLHRGALRPRARAARGHLRAVPPRLREQPGRGDEEHDRADRRGTWGEMDMPGMEMPRAAPDGHEGMDTKGADMKGMQHAGREGG